jgi:5-methylcytosine-specific restriction enzyme subunit McrC
LERGQVRTIELKEYQAIPVRLTRSEALQLASTDTVDLKPLFSGEEQYELKAKNIVGTIVFPSLQLLIRPKIGLKNLFFLLGYELDIASWWKVRFPYAEDPDLLEAMAHLFESEVRRASRQGLVRGYQARQETLTTLRGRIDITGQIRTRQDRPFPLECSFEEYTEDIELNRIVKAALRRLLRFPGLSPDLIRGLRFRYRIFDAVTAIEYAPGSVPTIDLILEEESLRDKIGETLSISFTVDMNKLFERFVEKVVNQEVRRAKNTNLRLVAQAPRQLAANVPIIPDLVLSARDKDIAVGDAKYKEPGKDKPANEDLFQLLSYCVSLGLKSGLLIYSGNFDRHYRINQSDIVLEATSINLTGEPEQIETSARNAARRLIKNADAFTAERSTPHTAAVEAGVARQEV